LRAPRSEATAEWIQRTGATLPALVLAAAGTALLAGAVSGFDPRIAVGLTVGLAFAAVVFVDLFAGFVVMVLFAFLEVLSVLGGVSLAKTAGALLVLAWLAAMTTGGRRARNFFVERPGLSYLLLAFVGLNAVSLAWAQNLGVGVSSVTRYALNAALLPIAYTAVDDRRDAVRILATVVAGGAIAAVSGILTAPDASADTYARAAGTVGDPNELAAALVVGLALAAAFAGNRAFARPWRIVSLTIAVLCLLGILLSLSRGGLIGVVALVVMGLLVGGRWRKQLLAGALALAVAAVGYFAFVASLPATERVLNVSGGTGRLDLWTVATRMIDANPLTGVGSGQFQVASIHYLLRPGALQRGDLIISTPKVAHNTYLEVITEIGIPGGILFVAIALFCFGCACAAIRRFEQIGDERMEILTRGFVAGLGAYFVTILFISENVSKLLWTLLALGPAMLAVATAAQREREAPP
jgi:O-antigen ligase